MRYGEAFVNGNSMRDTVTRVKNNTSGATRSVKRKHGLQGNKEGWRAEGFEKNLGQFFAVASRVQWSLREQNRVLESVTT